MFNLRKKTQQIVDWNLHLPTKEHRFEKAFENIEGYDDVKEIVRLALDSEDAVNMIFIGPPASAKTLFLNGIMEYGGARAKFFDATNTTNRILDVLDIERPKIICLDEIEKMPKNFQEKMLNFLESGRIKVDQQRRQIDIEMKGVKVFGAANDVTRVTKPLLSRFTIPIYLQRYTQEQFVSASIKVLKKERKDLPQELAEFIGNHVFERGSDIRKVVGIGRLVRKEHTPEKVLEIMDTLDRYSTYHEGGGRQA